MYRKMTYSAVCIALATVLSYVTLFRMPQGGSVTACSMIFISLIGYWFGSSAGILAGVSYGILQFLLGRDAPVHAVQLLLDYPLAFGALGLSGFFRNRKFGLFTGYLTGVVGRFACSFLSGFIFFSMYAPEGMNPVWYSALYNLSYTAPEAVITVVILLIPAFRKAVEKVKVSVGVTA